MNKTYHRQMLKKPLPPGSLGREAAGTLTSPCEVAAATGLHLLVCDPAHTQERLVGKQNRTNKQNPNQQTTKNPQTKTSTAISHLCLLIRPEYSEHTTVSEENSQPNTCSHTWKQLYIYAIFYYALIFVECISKTVLKKHHFFYKMQHTTTHSQL